MSCYPPKPEGLSFPFDYSSILTEPVRHLCTRCYMIMLNHNYTFFKYLPLCQTKNLKGKTF